MASPSTHETFHMFLCVNASVYMMIRKKKGVSIPLHLHIGKKTFMENGCCFIKNSKLGY